MKKLLMVFSVVGLLFGADTMYQSVELKNATILADGNSKEYCPNCGMNIPKFYKTSHAVKFKDGKYRQFCSIHCLVDESEMGYLRDKKNKISQILVADTIGLKIIDTKTAFYVIGSKIAGTMTVNSQYAFASKTDAQEFMKANGGKLMSFDEAYTMALKDFTADIKMLKSKKEDSVYMAGQSVMKKFCDETKIMAIHAHNVGETKQAIKESGACQDSLSDGQLQALTLYYWDVKLGNFEKQYGALLK